MEFVESEVCWDLFQIHLPVVLVTIKLFSFFEHSCLALKTHVVYLEIFYIIKIILFPYCSVEAPFRFWKGGV